MDLEESEAEVAVTVTVAGFGTALGAVYITETPEALLVADSVPHVAPVHPIPETVQFTPAFFESFATVAVSDICKPVCTDMLAGVTVTCIAGGGVFPPPVFGTVAQPATSRLTPHTPASPNFSKILRKMFFEFANVVSPGSNTPNTFIAVWFQVDADGTFRWAWI
jgi:hypothetical protein